MQTETTGPQELSLTEIFGEPISTYTRAQAIEDGVLIDISATAREAGIRVHAVMTSAAYEDCVAWTDADNARKKTYQDEAGRLWDVVYMGARAMRRAADDADEITFEIVRVPRSGRVRLPKRVRLTAKIGPGDQGEPVITIGLES